MTPSALSAGRKVTGKMAREAFVTKRFNSNTLDLIETCVEIMDDYAAMDLDLTVRQLYYQLVSRDIIENTDKSYDRISRIINEARLAGLMDWAMIVDRGRPTTTVPTWDEPHDILQSCIQQFRTNRWETQPYHVEIMCEKQALEGIFKPICSKWGISYTSNKGYCSQSVLHQKGKEIEKMHSIYGKQTRIFYFGDHDPSGLDMDRDLNERLKMFSGCEDIIHRVSLSMPQIVQFKPPPNPAKLTDSRAKDYVKKHGGKSWELDAMDPRYLKTIAGRCIEELIEWDAWDEACERENDMKLALENASDNIRRW